MRIRHLALAIFVSCLVLLPFARVLGQGAGEYSGFIDDTTFYQIIDLPAVPDGASIIVEVETTNGDLDPVAILFFENEIWAAENDDRSASSSNPYLKYESAPGGDYYVVISRYGLEEGETSGDFTASVTISTVAAAPLSSVNDATEVDLDAAGYPTLDVQPVAEWTVLIYLGAD
ncbi:MAG TPA: hypothetical protein VER79_05155, partial [Candidatus Limnocylindrales bacterium]|nr:hypothetical protein [Candidatus Limnocylindrales bacterium]